MALGYNESPVINIPSNKVGLEMLDKLSRMKTGRRIQPLDPSENINYNHRYLYDTYNLQIGDTYFMIPPEFIMVTSEATSQSIVTLRQENSQKLKSGYHKRTILADLVFNGIDQINGYKVEGPEGDYYVDGLRQLLAQFKCTPFLPITHEMINGMYGIFTVVLQAITIRAVPGFPNMLIAQVTLQEVEMFPYIEMPNIAFRYMIDWDLFRFYYQRLLTENHDYKKLQSLPADKERNRFKLSILNASVLFGDNTEQESLLQMICDDANYTKWVSSDESDVVISDFQCSYSNLLTNIQLSDTGSPTVQFMGGMDTLYHITFETTDYSVVQAIEQCQISNDVMVRENIKYHSVGFVKLESELVEFTGSLFVMIENVTTNTVPGFADLYNVQISCVSYDIAQSDRENLSGFLPFECDRCGTNSFVPDHIHDEQAIGQNEKGLRNKIRQDNYAEWKLRTSVEVYPDLHLPTYAEVDEFIGKCASFRASKGLNGLPYSNYPTAPVNMLHGSNPNNTITFESTDGIINASSIERSSLEYNIFVDPDFYVFYPCSYGSFEEEAKKDGEEYYNTYKPKQRASYTKQKVYESYPDIEEAEAGQSGIGITSAGSMAEQFVTLANSFIGHSYVLGTEGENSDAAGLTFDCAGLVQYCLKAVGAEPADDAPWNVPILCMRVDLFDEVPWESMQRGDIITTSSQSHVVIYRGDGTIVHASNEAPYPEGGVKDDSLYFTDGKVWRPKAFASSNLQATSTPTDGNVSLTGASNKEKIWNFLKQKGCSDFTAAGIVGNLEKESTTFNVVDNEYGYSEPTNGSGFGIVQWTYSDRQGPLMDWCTSNGLDYHTLEGQLNFMWYEMNNKYAGMMPELLGATSTDQATMTFHDNYEVSGDNESQLQERRDYAARAYAEFTGKAVPGATSLTGGGIGQTNQYNLTMDEFKSICKTVMAETKGEPPEGEFAMAQVIYDRVTHPQKIFGGLSNILTGADQFNKKYPAALNSTVEAIVKKVFCENKRYWPNAQAWYFLTPQDGNGSFQSRDENGDRLTSVGRHTYWGKNKAGSNAKFTINGKGVGPTSQNVIKTITDILHPAITIENADAFGEPVIISIDSIRYIDNGIFFWANYGKKDRAMEKLNSGENIFNTSFCDEVQYSGRGKLIRGFPTYLFCILDDNAAWFDGRKLWTNYYVHRSVVDISCHETNDMPTATATVVITNSYHNLDRTQTGLAQYNLKEDANGLLWPTADGYSMIQQTWYKMTGSMPSFGPRLTNKLIELHQIIYNQAMLKDGARVHIRMGYGSDPLSLAPVINGYISDVQLGDQIAIVVTSDGCELIQHVTSTTEKDVNDGIFGLFGLGAEQESSNIIASIMTARQSWFNHLSHKTFEGSKYSIEHFGLYSHQGLTNSWEQWISEVGLGSVTLADTWNGVQEQYDILKNIYKANYKKEHYIYTTLLDADGEQNIVFNQYNMTPWDVFQLCTQQVPEYILKVTPHQFDSRLYFGLPFWMEKYRYNYFNKKAYEECKASTQVHMLDSMTNIIDNQIKVTSKFSHTNIKCMYQLGKSIKSTAVIHSDDTIDFSRQKTMVLDTPIVQDNLGPDALYEFFQYKIGRESARRVGISNLLYGWEQQYQGQILLMGSPGIKAHDRIIINDTFAKIVGLASVREVVHSFNTNTGYTTSVVPGMIAMSTDENGGMIETNSNFLMILACFASYTNARRQMRVNYEQNLKLLSDIEVMRGKVLYLQIRGYLNDVLKEDQGLLNIGAGVYGGNIVFQMAKNIGKLKKAGELGKTFVKGYKTAMEGVKVVKGLKGFASIYKGIKAGVILITGVPTAGVGSIISAIVFIAIDILLGAVIEWLSNKNVCVLIPLWWEGYPFVAGVKGGEKILLVDSNATATGENTRADADPVLGAEFDTLGAGSSQPNTPASSSGSGANYFGPDEFKCECGCGGDVKQELKDQMNKVREIIGVEMNITSGFRCPEQNARDDGAPDSLHMDGEAADAQIADRSAEMIDKLAEAGQAAGLGTIRYYEGFVHFQLWPRDTVG